MTHSRNQNRFGWLEQKLQHLLQEASSHELVRSESGLMAWSTIFATMVLLIMFSLVANSVDTVNKKLETQNAADSVAYSSTV